MSDCKKKGFELDGWRAIKTPDGEALRRRKDMLVIDG